MGWRASHISGNRCHNECPADTSDPAPARDANSWPLRKLLATRDIYFFPLSISACQKAHRTESFLCQFSPCQFEHTLHFQEQDSWTSDAVFKLYYNLTNDNIHIRGGHHQEAIFLHQSDLERLEKCRNRSLTHWTH